MSSPLASNLPATDLLTAIRDRFPLPTREDFRGNHALLLERDGTLSALIWYFDATTGKIRALTVGIDSDDSVDDVLAYATACHRADSVFAPQ